MNQEILMKMLKEARKKKEGIGAEYTKINTLVDSLIEQCKHKWESDGHTSHEDRFVCSECDSYKFE